MIKTDMKGIATRGNSYTLTVSMGFDGNGKQIRKYSTFKPPSGTPKERADRLAMKAYEEFYSKCHRLENENGNMFFKDLASVFFEEYAENQLKRTTADQYRRAINNHAIPVFGNKRLKAIQKRDIQSFLCNQPSLKGSSCRKLKVVLSSVFSFAVEEGFIESNPCTNARCKKSDYDPSNFDYLTKDETIRLLDATKEYSQLNTIIRLLLLTGMRIGELLALNYITDIDFDYNLIKINSTLSYAAGEWFVDTTKTPSSKRVIKVNSAIMEMIKEELKHREKRKEIHGSSWTETFLLFARADGTCLNKTTLNKQFKALLKKNNLPPIHLHSLRHTFATLLIYLGNDTKAVSTALGHSQTQITNDTYVHIFEEYTARMSDSLCNDILKASNQ